MGQLNTELVLSVDNKSPKTIHWYGTKMFTHFIALDTNQIVIRGELFEDDYKILEEEVNWAIWRRKISFDIYVLLFSLNDKMSRIFKKNFCSK